MLEHTDYASKHINAFPSNCPPFPEGIHETPKRLREWRNARARFHTTLRCRTVEQHRNWIRAKWLHEDGYVPMGACTTFLDLFIPSYLAPYFDQRKITRVGLGGQNNINYGPFFINLNYSPKRVRRGLPEVSISIKKAFARTVGSRAAELYVLWKVSDLDRSFSFLDLAEFRPEYARKLILALKRRGIIRPKEPRTKPRFYECLVKLELNPVSTPLPSHNNVCQSDVRDEKVVGKRVFERSSLGRETERDES